MIPTDAASIGETAIDAIIKGGLVQWREGDDIYIWSANAPEQIGQAVVERHMRRDTCPTDAARAIAERFVHRVGDTADDERARGYEVDRLARLIEPLATALAAVLIRADQLEADRNAALAALREVFDPGVQELINSAKQVVVACGPNWPPNADIGRLDKAVEQLIASKLSGRFLPHD